MNSFCKGLRFFSPSSLIIIIIILIHWWMPCKSNTFKNTQHSLSRFFFLNAKSKRIPSTTKLAHTHTHTVKVPCWWGSPSGSSAVWSTASAAGSWCGSWNCLPAWCVQFARLAEHRLLPTTVLLLLLPSDNKPSPGSHTLQRQSSAKSDRVNSRRQRGVRQVSRRLAVVVGKPQVVEQRQIWGSRIKYVN